MTTVLLDLRPVRGALHGIARYALELAGRLPRLRPEWRFVGLTGPAGLPDDLGPLTPRLPLVRSAADFLSPLEQPALLASLAAARPHLFHATSFSLPALWPGRLVATLHDANHLALPGLYGPKQWLYYRAVVAPRARAASALITISEFSRDELAKHLRLSPYRFQVIPQGVSETFRPATAEEQAAARRRYGLPARFLLAVGNEKPHKNLALLAHLAPRLPLPIVLLAGKGAAARFGFPSSTLELPPVPESDLAPVYSAATALLFPSRYEGFGLPVLEAMACGCPVIASRASALPEVVGDAGLLVAPTDPHDWLSAVQRLVQESATRQSLGALGLERAARFRWDDCARRTLAVYERALG